METIEDVVKKCIDNWGIDERTKHLLEETIKWLSFISLTDQHVYIRLLKKFKYYSLQTVQIELEELKNKYFSTEAEYLNSIYLPIINKKSVHNHSYDIRSVYQNISGVTKDCFPVELYTVIEEYPLEMIKNIVFIDDMTGSGRTIKESLEYMYYTYTPIFNKKKIYLLLIEACESGLATIMSLKDDLGLDINIIYNNLHHKAFMENYIYDISEVACAKEIVLQYERTISNNSQYILGYEDTQALLAFYYDTPNSTLCSFWWSNYPRWNPIFPRKLTSLAPPWSKDLSGRRKQKGKLKYKMATERHRVG